jgi:hypothetical protein
MAWVPKTMTTIAVPLMAIWTPPAQMTRGDMRSMISVCLPEQTWAPQRRV